MALESKELDLLRTRAATIVKYHSRKHPLLRAMKTYLSKRAFTEKECMDIIEVGKTFQGQAKDPWEPPRNINRMAASGQFADYATELEGKYYAPESQ